MTEEQEIKPIPWVDFVRFIAAFLVVLAHIEGWNGEPSWASTLYYTITRVGVPFFFLISGYLLLSKEEDVWTFLKKRASRLIIPFLAWSIFYDLIHARPFEESGVTLEGILKMFIRILRGARGGHLWFLYSLLGLYLLTPILRVFVAKAKPSELYYYIGLWFMAAPVLYIIEGLTPLRNGFEIYYVGGYVGYFLIGYVLGRLETTSFVTRLALIFFIVTFAFSFFAIWYGLPTLDNELPFRSYPSLNVILMSIAAFILTRVVGEKAPAPVLRISELAGKFSFGIYLIHVMVIVWVTQTWKGLGFDPTAGNSLFVLPVVAIVVFLISWGIVFLISKIPFVRAIV
jgi:surface polysaccharide O-acyltransferase-like enzyme